MKTRHFSFDIPDELIAQKPLGRGKSRLLVLDRAADSLSHRKVADFPELLEEGSVVVFNNSKVRKARLFALSETGGKVEFLLLRQEAPLLWEALVSKSKRQKSGKRYRFPGGLTAEIAEEREEGKLVRFDSPIDEEYLENYGQTPLPPYIRRDPDEEDDLRYQTVYAENYGSAAAPTAGLHFTEEILSRITQGGVSICYVTLHVGIGTFLPIRTEKIEEHKMHREEYTVPDETAEIVNRAKKEGRKIVAVGTTSVRTLEAASDEEGSLIPGTGSTDLYIYPGYTFRTVDQMFTNFHTPHSSLLVMVSAFAGYERIKRAYSSAVERKYRFFSYGDAMFIK